MIERANKLVLGLEVISTEKYLNGRIELLGEIKENCPTIYIGYSAKSRLHERIKNGILKDRNHAVKYPVWILWYFGWQLKLRYKKISITENELNEHKIDKHQKTWMKKYGESLEGQLIEDYMGGHDKRKPALNIKIK